MSDFDIFTDEDKRERAQARAAADVFIDIVERHERENHDGDICPIERAGMVAFVAHCLGCTEGALGDVAVFLRDYEETHEHRHEGRDFDD